MEDILKFQKWFDECILVLLAWRLYGLLFERLGDFFESSGVNVIKLFSSSLTPMPNKLEHLYLACKF